MHTVYFTVILLFLFVRDLPYSAVVQSGNALLACEITALSCIYVQNESADELFGSSHSSILMTNTFFNCLSKQYSILTHCCRHWTSSDKIIKPLF